MSDNLPTELERWRNKVTADMAGRAFALRCIDMGRVLALVEKCHETGRNALRVVELHVV